MGALFLLLLACSRATLSAAVRVDSYDRRDAQNSSGSVAGVEPCELVDLHCTELLRRLEGGQRCPYSYQHFLTCTIGMGPVDDAFVRWAPGQECADFYVSKTCTATMLPGGGYYLLPRTCRQLHLGLEHCERMATLTQQFSDSWRGDTTSEDLLKLAVPYANQVIELKGSRNTEWMILPNIRYIIYWVAESLNSLKEDLDDEAGDQLGPLWNILLSYCQTMSDLVSREEGPFCQGLADECPALTMLQTTAAYHPALAAANEGLPTVTSLSRLLSLGVSYLTEETWTRLMLEAGQQDPTMEKWGLLKSKATELVRTAPDRGVAELELALQLIRSRHDLFDEAPQPEGGQRRLDEMSSLRDLTDGISTLESHRTWPHLRALQKSIFRADVLGPVVWTQQAPFTQELDRARELAQTVETSLAQAHVEEEEEEEDADEAEEMLWGHGSLIGSLPGTLQSIFGDEDTTEDDLELLYGSAIGGFDSMIVPAGDEIDDRFMVSFLDCESGLKLRDGTCAKPETIVRGSLLLGGQEKVTLADGKIYRCCCKARGGRATCELLQRKRCPGFAGFQQQLGTRLGRMATCFQTLDAAASADICPLQFGTIPTVAQCAMLEGGRWENGMCLTGDDEVPSA